MAAIDVREENDPLRDASRPYGQASADANALRALSSIGGGGATPPLPTSRSQQGRTAAPPLRPLVAAGTPLPYAGPVASGQGGRNQGDDGGLTRPTFQSSDVLTQRALAMFPPAVQSAFANQKIERPADTSEIYGAPARSVNIGGGYWPGSGKIALGRGIEQTSGPNDAVNGTMHEILHAISNRARDSRRTSAPDTPNSRLRCSTDSLRCLRIRRRAFARKRPRRRSPPTRATRSPRSVICTFTAPATRAAPALLRPDARLPTCR
jgi:hypothetical protein